VKVTKNGLKIETFYKRFESEYIIFERSDTSRGVFNIKNKKVENLKNFIVFMFLDQFLSHIFDDF